MARTTVLLGGSLSLLLAGGLAVAAPVGGPERGPVYAVAQVAAQLAHHPRAWTDRPLLLRAVAAAAGCWVETADIPAFCAPPRLVLRDAEYSPTVAPLPLAWAGPDPLLAVVRRVPLLGGLLPAPQAVRWAAAAVYRVELRGVPAQLCGGAPCYEALLLDAAPDGPGEG
jgi:hypothetical protein